MHIAYGTASLYNGAKCVKACIIKGYKKFAFCSRNIINSLNQSNWVLKIVRVFL